MITPSDVARRYSSAHDWKARARKWEKRAKAHKEAAELNEKLARQLAQQLLDQNGLVALIRSAIREELEKED